MSPLATNAEAPAAPPLGDRGPGASDAPGAPGAADPGALAARVVRRVRREWRVAQVARSSLLAVAAGALVAVLLVALDLVLALPPGARRVLTFAVPMAVAVPLVLAAIRLVRSRDGERFALLAEERLPWLENGLITALTTERVGAVGRLLDARLRPVLAEAVDGRRIAPWRLARPLAAFAGGTLLLALLVALSGGPTALAESWTRPDHEAPLAVAPGSPLAPGPDALPRVTAIRWSARPPSYTGGTTTEVSPDEPVVALAGSRVTVRFYTAGPSRTWAARLIGTEGPVTVQHDGRVVSASFLVTPDARGIALEGGEEEVVARRVVPVSVLEDAAPTVTLETPERDEVLATADAVLSVRARAVDDHGVADLRVGWIRSRGSGESFAFEEGEAPLELADRPSESAVGTARLDLMDLGLEPGDVLHVRAMARDRNDVTGPGLGVSTTRVIRIAGEGEEHTVTALVGAPPDVEERPVLSQRMIILMTEELREEAPSLSRAQVMARAAGIAREQARLRSQVGEVLFARSTGGLDTPPELADPLGGDYTPHGHADHEHVEGDEDWDPADPAAVLEAASLATGTGVMEELSHVHDDAPVIAVNRELMGAYNAMYEAERALRQAEPDAALPPEYRALEILQEVREGDRVFVRGEVTVPPLDVGAARGTGELTDLAVADRTAGPASGAGSAQTALDEAMAALSLPPARAALVITDAAARLLADGAIDAGTAALLSRAADAAAAGRRTDASARLAEARSRLEPSAEMGTGIAHPSADDAVAAAYLHGIAALGGPERETAIPNGAGEDSAPFVFATARYASGDWDSAPLVGVNLMHSLAQYTGIRVGTEAVVVDLSSEEVFDYPFLFLTGHLPVRFTEAETRNLRQFVERGGLLLVDDHNHDIDAAFHRTVTAELRRLFGDDALQPLPEDHEIYTAFFRFDDGPPTTTHELNGWGDGLIHDELHAVTVDGRVGVLYSNKDYASEWNYHVSNKRFQALDNTRIGVNILLYALTR